MKKLIALLLATVMVLGLAACGSKTEPSTAGPAEQTEKPADTSTGTPATTTEKDPAEASPAEEAPAEKAPAADGEKPTIAFVPKVMGQAWWDYVQSGVESWAASSGYDVIYKGPTEVDAAAQVQIMTDLVNQGVDILCFSPNDPNACEQICKQAMDKGIIVIATEASGMSNVNYDVEAFNEEGFGAFLMDLLAQQMGEEGEYITMVGSMTMESQNNWADAAVARQEEKYPNMTLVADKRVENGSDAERAYELTKELKTKYPELKGILGTGSFDAPGAARAIDEMGLTGQMFATSCALPSETRDFLKAGVLQGVGLWDPAVSAQAMLNLAVAMFNGETPATGMDLGVEGYDNVTIDGTLVVGDGQIAITADNVDSFTF